MHKEDFDLEQACKHFGQIFGHNLKQLDLWERALRHRSLNANATQNNERLEFLGDRVMGMSVAGLLYEQFPYENEGDLSRRHARLVSRDTLVIVGYKWAVLSFLQKARNVAADERKSIKVTGKNKVARGDETMMADAVEALLGALYIEHGFDAVQKIVTQVWKPLIESQSAPPVDSKSALQEWSQGKGLGLPTYVAVAQTGPDHAPEFTIEVHLKGHKPISGSGRNKRLAEREAAKLALEAWNKA